MASLDDSGVPPEEPKDHGRGAVFLSARSTLIITISAIVGLLVGLSAGVSAAMSVDPPVAGSAWQAVVGLLAGLAGGIVTSLLTAASLHSLIDKS